MSWQARWCTTAGAASGYDLRRIQLELAAYDDLIAAAETELGAARIRLGVLAGAPGGLDAADPLALPPEPPPLEALLRDGVARTPEYRAAGARADGARALATAARRGWIPDLALSGGYIRQDVSRSEAASGYSAGVSLTVPLFDHGQADRARAQAIARAAQADREIIAREVPARVGASHQALVRTVARARAVRDDQLGQLELLLRSAETAYREGGGNVIELLDAYSKARDTRLRDLELRRDARAAELDLWLALGRRL